MELLKSRLDLLDDALTRLKESFEAKNKPGASLFYIQIRDSIIKSLEFSYDLFWKSLKDFLENKHGILESSPRKVFREALTQGFITINEYKLLESIIDDRNDTSHKYDEKKAEEIAARAPKHYKLMYTVAERMTKEPQQP